MDSIYHPDFAPNRPYWWDFFTPIDDLCDDLPTCTGVAIIGGGYTGLSAAITLARHGIESVVLEAEAFGHGASTRNGGGVGGAINVGKSLGGRRLAHLESEREGIVAEAAQAFGAIESLITNEEIACDWQVNGRFVGAWTPAHFRAQEASLALLNAHGGLGAEMVPRDRQHEELRTDLYCGGMSIARSATVNPALLYKGLLDRAMSAGVKLCAHTRVAGVERSGVGWAVTTERGLLHSDHVIVAANGYIDKAAPRLRRKIVPVLSNVIVTEELPDGLAGKLFPTNRYVNDSLRIRSYFRLTPDKKRVLFGGRGRFGRGSYDQHATALYRMMLARLPDLRGIRITHAWSGRIAFTLDSLPHVGEEDGMHYALGCNGSGIAMMNYLGAYIAQKVAEKQSSGAGLNDLCLAMRSTPAILGSCPRSAGIFSFSTAMSATARARCQ